MSADDDRYTAPPTSVARAANRRARRLVDALGHKPDALRCAGDGCRNAPTVAIRTAHKPIAPFCEDCGEAELSRYQTAREYPLDATTPPELATSFTRVEESATGVGYELSPDTDESEHCEMWVAGRNTQTTDHCQETVIDLDQTV